MVGTCGLKAIQSLTKKFMLPINHDKDWHVPCVEARDCGTAGLSVTVAACVCAGIEGLFGACDCPCGIAGLLEECSCAGTMLPAVCGCGAAGLLLLARMLASAWV